MRLGFIIFGFFCVGIYTGYLFGTMSKKKTPDRLLYEAYTACIPLPGCMSADDYIDYYDLKWRLVDESLE